jgi:hypothetical protein
VAAALFLLAKNHHDTSRKKDGMVLFAEKIAGTKIVRHPLGFPGLKF